MCQGANVLLLRLRLSRTFTRSLKSPTALAAGGFMPRTQAIQNQQSLIQHDIADCRFLACVDVLPPGAPQNGRTRVPKGESLAKQSMKAKPEIGVIGIASNVNRHEPSARPLQASQHAFVEEIEGAGRVGLFPDDDVGDADDLGIL